MTNAQYLATVTALWVRLEKTFARGYAPILNSMFMEAAKQVEHGNVRGAQMIVDKYRDRQLTFLKERYKQTANILGLFQRDYLEEKKVDIKEPLSLDYWSTIDRWSETTAALKVTYMDITSKRLIANVITKGLNEGFGSKKIATALRKTGVVSSRVRAITIARTETHGAASMATHTMSVQAGAKEKFWMDAGDKRVRNSHKNVEGGAWIPINENFNVGGEMMEKPGDSFASGANVINCRCSALYQKRRV